MIQVSYRVACDECPFLSQELATPMALNIYLMGDDHGDGKWCVTRRRRICRGCVAARACRIFGHEADATDFWCSRCQERIGPTFDHSYLCHFCGTEVQDDRKYDGTWHRTQDCRPDLFPHEKGNMCTARGSWCYWDHDYDRLSEGVAWEWAS